MIGGLADFKGKKVRVFNNTMRDFLAGVGATAVSMAFAEVVPALSTGVVDCARHRQPLRQHRRLERGDEVALSDVARLEHQRAGRQPQHLEPARPKVQAFLLEQIKAYEDKMWATIKTRPARPTTATPASSPAPWASSRRSTIVAVKPEEAEKHKKLVEGAVLAGWAKRCGAECAKEWNETVGKALGLKAPTP